jgi:MFS family permease
MIFVYYLPIWFQAIKGVNAVQSGLMILPKIIAVFIGSMLSGFVTKYIAYYVPSMIMAAVLMSIGAGLMTVFLPDTSQAMWIGYQAIYSFGFGSAMQASSLAAQAALPKEDTSIGMSLVFFTQQLSGAIFVAIGQNVFA